MCDICMKKRAVFDFSCAKHRICRYCQEKNNKRTYPKNCPVCRPLAIRTMEKQVGKPYITPSTYIPSVMIFPAFSESVSTLQAVGSRVNEDTMQYEPKDAISPYPTEQDYYSEFNDVSCQLSRSMSVLSSNLAYEESNEDQELFPSSSLHPTFSMSSSDISYSPFSLENSSVFFPLSSTNSLISG